VSEGVTIEQIAELSARRLQAEQEQRAKRLLRERATLESAAESESQFDWQSIRGVAPNLLAGEYAQQWITRTRREADEHRERQW
jgi:hypothetical protein